MANAQLPNEKFGKPSNLEWDFNGWGEAIDADAIILCKTMNATYQLSDQVENYNRTDIEVNWDNVLDFGKNQLDDSNILVRYEIGLRMKILKPEGAKHANIDITYFNADDEKVFNHDNLEVAIGLAHKRLHTFLEIGSGIINRNKYRYRRHKKWILFIC